MKFSIQLFLIVLFTFQNFTSRSQDIVFDWKKEYTTVGYSIASSIVTDSEKNSYFLGKFGPEIEINNIPFISNGPTDGIMVKLNEAGNNIWIKQFKSDHLVNLSSIAIDSNEDIYMVGSYTNYVEFDTVLISINPSETEDIPSSTMFIAKFNKEGDLIWARNTRGVDSRLNQITIDQDGHVLVAAKALTIDQFDGESIIIAQDSMLVTPDDIPPFWIYYYPNYKALAKYTSSGEFLWCKRIGGSPRDLITDSDNNIIIVGAIGIYAEGGGSLDANIYGEIEVEPLGSASIFTAKHDAEGELLWINLAGGSSNNNYANAVEVDQENNIYVTGKISGNDIEFAGEVVSEYSGNHAFLCKYVPGGEMQWVKEFGSPDVFGEINGIMHNNGGTSLKFNSLNELILAGFFADTLSYAGKTIVSDGEPDMMIMKLNQQGDVLDIGQYVLAGSTSPSEISIGPDDEIFFAGYADELGNNFPAQIMVGRIGASFFTPVKEVVDEENFNIFPMPGKTNESINIQFNKPIDGSRLIIVSDINGHQIIKTSVSGSSCKVKIPHPGYYIVSILEENRVVSKSIVVFD